MTYSSFKSEWLGRRIDYDRVYSYQCVDLILEYMYEVAHKPTGIWGNAVDYWYHPTATFANACTKISKANLKQGDIVVLAPIDSQPIHAAGHIGILDSKTTTTVRLLEQNAWGTGDGLGKNAIGVYRDIPMSRVLGGWRIKTVAPAPTPAPRQTVFLPSSVKTWRLYPVGGTLVPGTEKAVLTPYAYPPGLTYIVEARVGDYAVVITTQMYGRGTIWIKGTSAVIK